MEKLIVFGLLSIPIIAISWRTLFRITSHGFYRFFAWECIIWLLVSNYKFWFTHPLSPHQVISWIFLIYSGYLVIAGVIMLKKKGKPRHVRDEKTLYAFEETSELVDTGIYSLIRHPLYSSLLFLTWGICLKNFTLSLFVVALLSSVFLFLTAIADESECKQYFGDKYHTYMKKTKRFIPYIF